MRRTKAPAVRDGRRGKISRTKARPAAILDIPAICSRSLNKLSAAEIARIFRTSNPLPNYPPRYNIASTTSVLAVRFNPPSRRSRRLLFRDACSDVHELDGKVVEPDRLDD